MHTQQITQSGNQTMPSKALIMIHGRGSNAQDIMSLSDYLQVPDFLLLGPQAAANTWYPHSFIAPVVNNQPYLDDSLAVIEESVELAKSKGVTPEEIYLLGFSQGACLALEFASRHAQRFGGIVAFSGGLIGEELDPNNYNGDFQGTPIFIGSSDPDAHVPVERVQASTQHLIKMGATVTERIYPEMGHRITKQQIDLVNALIFNVPDRK